MKRILAATLIATLPMSVFADEGQEPPTDAVLAADSSTSGDVGSDEKSIEDVWNDITVKFGGRLQLDYAWFDDDRDDGGEVRRARLFAKGNIGQNWDYKVQLDFAGGEAELKDGYARYKGLGPGTLWLGNYKQPVGLDVLTSSKYTTFAERGIATDNAEGRRIGVGYQYVGSSYTLMASVYGDEANEAAKGTGFQGRATWTPVMSDGMIVHLGGSGGLSRPQGGTARIRVRPELHVTDDRILDTGPIENVDDILRSGLEAAVVANRFSAQAEYVRADLSRSSDLDLSFDGWYAYASWFLTPDSRNYSAKAGEFDKIVPSRSSGAWEIALRYSTLNLTDQEVLGGSGDAVTLGLNWYVNTHLRFTGNYVAVDTDEVAGNDDPNVFQVRMQIVF